MIFHIIHFFYNLLRKIFKKKKEICIKLFLFTKLLFQIKYY